MKLIRFIFFNGALFALLASSSISNAQENFDQKLDCYSIIVGKNASIDGSVLFAHNEDTGGDRVVNYFKVPRTKHNVDEKITFINGGQLEQVTTTNAYLWINLPGAKVCDSYINEFGVAICSDGCPSREKNPELTDGGILFWLRRIVAERAKSAREGIKIAGQLIDKYGYADSGRTYMIADPNEGWMLSVVNGKHWVAARVPDDEVAVIPNYYTLGTIDLSDTINYLGSPDIITYAIEQGWYDPSDGEFHFAKTYSRTGSLNHPGNITRMWRGVNMVSGRNFELDDDLPFTTKPLNKISVQNIMNVLRDHYEGTVLDHSKNYTLGNPYKLNNTTICSNGTQYSLVAHLRNWIPASIGAMAWITTFRPDAQAYLPWYVCIDDTPEFHRHTTHQLAIDNQFNPSHSAYDNKLKHTYWVNKALAENVNKDYKKMYQIVRETWDGFEDKTSKKVIDLEKKALNVYKKNPQKAEELISDFTRELAAKTYIKTGNLIQLTDQNE
jgi:dipeptidase